LVGSGFFLLLHHAELAQQVRIVTHCFDGV
jgi:hypothetical protein